MNAPSSSIPVEHNSAAHRFETVMNDQLSVAEYIVAGDRMIFTHTFVPPALRGRGIAEALVRAGLAEARRAGRRVDPQCSYVARFIESHAEFRDLVA